MKINSNKCCTNTRKQNDDKNRTTIKTATTMITKQGQCDHHLCLSLVHTVHGHGVEPQQGVQLGSVAGGGKIHIPLAFSDCCACPVYNIHLITPLHTTIIPSNYPQQRAKTEKKRAKQRADCAEIEGILRKIENKIHLLMSSVSMVQLFQNTEYQVYRHLLVQSTIQLQSTNKWIFKKQNIKGHKKN